MEKIEKFSSLTYLTIPIPNQLCHSQIPVARSPISFSQLKKRQITVANLPLPNPLSTEVPSRGGGVTRVVTRVPGALRGLQSLSHPCLFIISSLSDEFRTVELALTLDAGCSLDSSDRLFCPTKHARTLLTQFPHF